MLETMGQTLIGNDFMPFKTGLKKKKKKEEVPTKPSPNFWLFPCTCHLEVSYLLNASFQPAPT